MASAPFRAGPMHIVRTVRQSPALLAVFVAAITLAWGKSPVWWKRQISLMILITFCTLARGAGVTGCLRRGISWVRYDGTQCSTPTEGARANCQQTFRHTISAVLWQDEHKKRFVMCRDSACLGIASGEMAAQANAKSRTPRTK